MDVAAERDFQYCTEVLVRGDGLPPANEVRAAMHAFGGSTVVAVMGDILKIHVHTDTPEAVFSYAARWGRVDTTKAEDMRVQHRRLAHTSRRAVAIVTDSSADLPDSVLDRHRDRPGPVAGDVRRSTFRDRVELKPEEFYRRLRGTTELPTTSQPTPAAFIQAFRDARQEADEVVAVLLGSNLSGTFASAQAAIRAGGAAGGSSGGQPPGVIRRGAAGAPRCRAGGARVARRANCGGADPASSPVRDAPDGGSVRQPASVGTDLTGEGLARGNAGCQTDPLVRCRRVTWFRLSGCGAGESGGTGAGRAGSAPDTAPSKSPFRCGTCRRPRSRRADTRRAG